MNRRTLFYGLGAAAVMFGAAACSSDSTAPGTATNAEITASARADAGESAVLTIDQFGANEDFMGADVAGASAATSGVAVTCTGPDASGWYTCTAVTEFGLTVTRQVRFWEGTAYGLGWNPGVTDSVNHHWTAIGTFPSIGRAGKTWTIDDATAATMIVIPGTMGMMPRHSWSATADRHQSSTYTMNQVERILDHVAHDTVSAVAFQVPRRTNPYPLSGTIIRNVTTDFTAGSLSRTVTRRFVITFNGTNIVTLTDGALTCDLNLDLRTVSNCH